MSLVLPSYPPPRYTGDDGEVRATSRDCPAWPMTDDDRRLHRGVGHQLAHVVANGVTAHDQGRREHLQAQYLAIERYRGHTVGYADAGVCQTGNHVLNLTSASSAGAPGDTTEYLVPHDL
ncbi:hypothetical protein A4G26_08770 [Mycobacterium kansasii]|uniref:Uncharacterized protein n=1 Tax=Mycobacterium innocens TaxID=2341083 RepID=A0A498PQD5_9MYCO|nr:hypothetical protein A4G26_08770 [Mycobacterium kansasii]VBA34377.1 hypothetical protein LAUMK13_00481 [Mycobacterium innocens]